MKKSEIRYKYIYGPVSSWRLGSSLGIDPISGKNKICTFNCAYCQLKETDVFNSERKIFVPTAAVIEEIKSLPDLKIDYITFSGRGEPTLAKNLGEMISEIKKIRKEKVALITNASLMDRKDVREDILLADFVMAKLDACSEELFKKINKPMPGITFDKVLGSIKSFKSEYKGRLALQFMFIEENKDCAEDLARIAREIKVDEVQINTSLRPCAVKPLPKQELDKIKKYFEDMNIFYVYETEKKKVDSISKEDTLLRRGKRG
ncbi:MAG: radical SAM protein [Candidatus Omnitrophica bacterium]|nr:radical SAM protein [Candidatus Omnitrophota bacterium]